MGCPYFESNPTPTCNAFLEGIKVPTMVEVENFCCNEDKYKTCPFYISKDIDINTIITPK